MRALPNDIRKSIIEAKKRGEPIEDIIKWFNVSRSTIFGIVKRHRETGKYSPLPFPGKRSTFTAAMNDMIYAKVSANPSITQEELISLLNLKITQAGMSLHMKKLNLTLKKRRCIPMGGAGKMLSISVKNGKKNKSH